MFESYYEEINSRNAVFTHRRELEKIDKGVSAKRFFSYSRLKILCVEYELLRLTYTDEGGRRYELTEKAKSLLKQIEEEEIEE